MNKSIAERLHVIGHALGEYYRRRAHALIDERAVTEAREIRARALTPADGWPGKNEEQRKAARETALAADAGYAALTNQQREVATDLTVVGADIEALEAERRALEWQVRCAQLAFFGMVPETPADDVSLAESTIEEAIEKTMPDAGTACDCGNPKLPSAAMCFSCLPFERTPR